VRDADHSPPSSAEVMEEWSYTSTHPLGHTGPVTGLLYLMGQTVGPVSNVQAVQKESLAGCAETSVEHHQSTLRNILENADVSYTPAEARDLAQNLICIFLSFSCVPHAPPIFSFG
jgi:hypothetical protein